MIARQDGRSVRWPVGELLRGLQDRMLTHPTIDRLHALGLTGMAHALEEQRRQPDLAQLGFDDRLALLVDRETLERDNKRLKA